MCRKGKSTDNELPVGGRVGYLKNAEQFGSQNSLKREDDSVPAKTAQYITCLFLYWCHVAQCSIPLRSSVRLSH